MAVSERRSPKRTQPHPDRNRHPLHAVSLAIFTISEGFGDGDQSENQSKPHLELQSTKMDLDAVGKKLAERKQDLIVKMQS